MFTITKAFIALVVAAYNVSAAAPPTSAATPSSTATPPPLAHCTFIIAAEKAIPNGTNLVGAINGVIESGLSDQLPKDNTVLFGSSASIIGGAAPNTFHVTDTIGVNGTTAAQSAALGNNLVGVTKTIIAGEPAIPIAYTITSASCRA